MSRIWFRWWFAPLAILFLGGLLLFSWLAYEMVFAGIPYQDPTPVLAAEYAWHSHVADIIGLAGLLTLVVGLAALGLSFVVNMVRSRMRQM